MDEWMEVEIRQRAVSYASAQNLPLEFIDGIKLRKSASGYILYNDWIGKFNEPLAKWFEMGTKRHWIEPKVKHPPGGRVEGRSTEEVEHGDGTSIQHPSVLHWVSNGVNFFSKGHYVSGIKAFKTMATAITVGMRHIDARVRRFIAARVNA